MMLMEILPPLTESPMALMNLPEVPPTLLKITLPVLVTVRETLPADKGEEVLSWEAREILEEAEREISPDLREPEVEMES